MPDSGTICPGLYDIGSLPSIDVQSWDIGRISCLAHEVKQGTKPVAEVDVRTSDLPGLRSELERHKVFCHAVPRGEGHVALYLYTHPHMLVVLRHLTGEKINKDVFETWAWGKVFGYSEQSIAEFINSNF